jgi:hypothetical protein
VAGHVLAGQGAQLEEVRVAIEEQLDPLPRQELAGRDVAAVVLVAATGGRVAQGRGQLGHRGQAGGVVSLEVVGLAVDVGAQDRVRLLWHRRRAIVARTRGGPGAATRLPALSSPGAPSPFS